MIGLSVDSSCWFCGLTDAHAPRCPRFTFLQTPAPVVDGKGVCSLCQKELCGELDAYYGFDAAQATKCRDCRD